MNDVVTCIFHLTFVKNKLCPNLPNATKVIVNCSGRGDKDAGMVLDHKLTWDKLNEHSKYLGILKIGKRI